MRPGIRMGSAGTGYPAYGEARNKLMRNTMFLLSASLVPTVVGAFVGMTPAFLMFMLKSPLIASLVMLALMFGFCMGIQRNQYSSTGVALLLGLTFFMGVWLGPMLSVVLRSAHGAMIVAEAAGGTALIFAVMATIVTVTKKDFSFIGNFLFVGLIMLLIASLANAFLHVPAMQLTIAAVAILVFSGYLLYDLSQVINNNVFGQSYVALTLQLYLDVYNIFVNLLYLLSALTGNDRR